MGVPIVEGRAFADADRPETPRVAVVNETFARRYWPRRERDRQDVPIRAAPTARVFEIVGVSADHKVLTLSEPPTPFLHVARSQRPELLQRRSSRARAATPTALLRDMRRELLALEPNLVFVENQTMEAEVDATLFPMRASAWLVSGVGLVAMLLAAIGLYGVIAYSVARRTREIGIRMALGARPGAVVGLVMRQGLLVAVAGLVAGCLLAAVAARAIAGALYGVGVCRSGVVAGGRGACCSSRPRSPIWSPPGAPPASIRPKRCAPNRHADRRRLRIRTARTCPARVRAV